MKKFLIVFSLLTFLSLGANAASVPNGGFETGNLAGWTANNSLVNVVTSQVVSTAGSYQTGPTAFTTVLPANGNYFAVLTAANPTTLTSSSFNVNAGDKVSFNWFFSAEDYRPFNDFGSYSLKFLIADTIVSADILSMVSMVGDYGYTGWNNFSYTSPLSGDFKLRFSAVNVGDKKLPSMLGVDNVSVNSTVPEPASLLLISIGLLALGSSRLSKKAIFVS